MDILIQPKGTTHFIATLCIGDQYFHGWKEYAFPTWKIYCEKYGIGLIVFKEDLLDDTCDLWKKRQWQKLLIGREMKNYGMIDFDVCYLDTDILINPMAPNVFDFHKQGSISVVSQKNNLPYPLEQVLRRIAFMRHTFYDKNYPLDSALFMSLEQIFAYHNLNVQNDYACTGFYVFNVKDHAEMMEGWFNKYHRDTESITGGGEEAHLNYELQSWGKLTWLDYRFQSLWIYEMAWKYPFLFDYGKSDHNLIKECVEASLFTNYFLHFAGSWYESQMWKINNIMADESKIKLFESFFNYLNKPVTGIPKGLIRP
jgi:hypothetical protein